MDINNTIGTNIVDINQILYNDGKEMSNMSYVIMMKCSDGIVCVSDSRLTKTVQDENITTYASISDTGTKVFKNKSLIIGVFGSYIIGNQTIDVVINNILNSAKTKFEFVELFSAQIADSKNYSIFIGEKKDNTFNMFFLKIDKNHIEIKGVDATNYFANKTDFSHDNLPKAINLIPVAQAQPLLISAVQNVIDLQTTLLPYAFVGGKIQCEILQ